MANTWKKDEPTDVRGLLLAVVRGTGTGLAGTVILVLLLSAVLLAVKDPETFIGWMSGAALFAGALIGGIAGTRADGRRSPMTGVLCGAAYVLILWVISLFFGGKTQEADAFSMAFRCLGCIAAALTGGFLGKGAKMRTVDVKHSPTAAARKQLCRK